MLIRDAMRQVTFHLNLVAVPLGVLFASLPLLSVNHHASLIVVQRSGFNCFCNLINSVSASISPRFSCARVVGKKFRVVSQPQPDALFRWQRAIGFTNFAQRETGRDTITYRVLNTQPVFCAVHGS